MSATSTPHLLPYAHLPAWCAQSVLCALLFILSTSPSQARPAPTPQGAETVTARTEAGTEVSEGVVNLNTATVDELQRLPRIGEEKALRIVAHRDTTPFKHVHELARVRGIGMKTLRKLKPYLATTGPTTLREKVRGGTARTRDTGGADEAKMTAPSTPPLIL